MPSRVLKWKVPVDDSPHEIGGGDVVFVATLTAPSQVEVWTIEDGDDKKRTVQVYGTGHFLPNGAKHLGSCGWSSPRLVWHVFEIVETDAEAPESA